MAVVTFSTSVTVDINDLEPGSETDSETKCTLYGRLNRLVSIHTPYGYTATHDALQIATQVSAPRHVSFLPRNALHARAVFAMVTLSLRHLSLRHSRAGTDRLQCIIALYIHLYFTNSIASNIS